MRAVTHRNQDDIAFIALHVFDILDENVLVLAFAQKRIQNGILTAAMFQHLGQHIGLSFGKGHDPKRQIRPVPCVASHCGDNFLRLDLVGACTATAFAGTGIDARHSAKLQTVVVIQFERRRWQHQIIAVELGVRHPDQRRIARAIMPFQHPLPQPARFAQGQYAFHIGGRGAYGRVRVIGFILVHIINQPIKE